jgi:steroid 5-alpha reductase family enzyme
MNWPAVAIGLVAMVLLMSVLWLIQRRTGDAGIVDVGRTFGVGFLAFLAAASGEGLGMRRVLLAALVGIWSLRLGVYLLRARVLNDHEDGRYQMLRETWCDRTEPLLFAFFQAQAVLAVLLALPFFLIAESPEALGPWDLLGLGLWTVALLGESIADRQLARFRGDPANRGRTCRLGLWRYSRHPNHFFEWAHWWTYPCLAATGALWPATIAVPLTMLFLLFRVTGIPYTEKQALRSRGEDYRRYQRETSVFLPRPPKTQEWIR